MEITKINNLGIILFMIYCFLSCHIVRNDTLNDVNQICLDYIELLVEKYEESETKLLINIQEEMSEDENYHAYRISSRPPYLAKSIVPSKFEYVNEYPTVYFLLEQQSSKQQEDIKKTLMEKGIHNSEMAFRSKSNYPEWVLLTDQKTKSSILIKDSWYKDLGKLVELYKKEF